MRSDQKCILFSTIVKFNNKHKVEKMIEIYNQDIDLWSRMYREYNVFPDYVFNTFTAVHANIFP